MDENVRKALIVANVDEGVDICREAHERLVHIFQRTPKAAEKLTADEVRKLPVETVQWMIEHDILLESTPAAEYLGYKSRQSIHDAIQSHRAVPLREVVMLGGYNYFLRRWLDDWRSARDGR